MIRMVLLGLGFVVVTAGLIFFQLGTSRDDDTVPGIDPVTRANPPSAPIAPAATADAGLLDLSRSQPQPQIRPVVVQPAPASASARVHDPKNADMRKMTWDAVTNLRHATGRDAAPGQPGSILHMIVRRSLDEAPETGAAPRRAAPVASSAITPRFYVVQSGDSLVSIAQKIYGDVNMTGAIFAANQATLARPDDLRPGQTLSLPQK